MPTYGENGGDKLVIKSNDGTKEMVVCLDDDGTPFFLVDNVRYDVNLTQAF